MCPMVPITLVAAILFVLVEYSSTASTPEIFFNTKKPVELTDGQTLNVSFWTDAALTHGIGTTNGSGSFTCEVTSSSPFTATVDKCQLAYDKSSLNITGNFQAIGDLLGHTDVTVTILKGSKKICATNEVHVIVVQKKTTAQYIFLGSTILLVSLNYVNMGCAIDMNILKETLKKPIGPILGMVTQYGVMPSLSYLTATLLLSESYLQLGLFTFGCSPGGGASNMWTVLLGGNLDLSITMTFISTIASLGMMPLWLFTVGKTFFRFCPKETAFCKKILTPFSISMIIFIIVFGTYANLYMFRLITWDIALAAMLNVWVGFFIGVMAARATGLLWQDAVTVMIETGIQNTGVAIVLLGVSLPKPDGDMAAIIPVTASVITPIPLTIIWLLLKLLRCPQALSNEEKIADKEDIRFLPVNNNSQ
ncbi:ileal sodium/bile acid cotransporter-like [Tropilaelaps mercedesae]|uniref:Ileal sodium/bile acid cotransporter-like n=1 Tax=Tropilaelaps mercedesae TaxID=418985 RepID=A0A1V9XVX1_9ACAR|nr:ileal sodium/bile acid cotransporter-like [Tropilaelaps mercedesae]